MKIEFSDEQLHFLEELLDEYADTCYHDMFEYKEVAVDAAEDFIKREYNAMADAEEERFKQVKALADYVRRYEELMRDA